MPNAKIDYKGRLSKGLNSLRDLTPGFTKVDLIKSLPAPKNTIPFWGPSKKASKRPSSKTEKSKKQKSAGQKAKAINNQDGKHFTKLEVRALILKFFKDYKSVAWKRGSRHFSVKQWLIMNLE